MSLFNTNDNAFANYVVKKDPYGNNDPFGIGLPPFDNSSRNHTITTGNTTGSSGRWATTGMTTDTIGTTLNDFTFPGFATDNDIRKLKEMLGFVELSNEEMKLVNNDPELTHAYKELENEFTRTLHDMIMQFNPKLGDSTRDFKTLLNDKEVISKLEKE